VSVIKPATLKALIESKLEMDKSELKKKLLEFVYYLKKWLSYTTSIVMLWNIRRLATLASRTLAKAATLAAALLDTNLEEYHMAVPAIGV
jgi:hypothetical protein